MDKESVARNLSEWFYTYHVDLYKQGVPFEVYVAKVQSIRRELGGARRVLDTGAGFGVYACLLRILGVPEVVAVDYHREKALVAARLVRYLGLDGVRVLHGDATVLPFRRGSFDAAIALASLSHIREPERALNEVAASLRPGGRLYVFEDNNSTYPGYEKVMRPVWEGAETGVYAGGLPAEKRIPESYIAIRRRMIAERFPDLGPEVLETCARSTRGLYGSQVMEAVEGYLSSGRIRNPRRHLVCNPLNGEFEELPLNPFIVERMFRRAGFEARVKSPVTGPFRGRWRPLKRLVAGVFQVCPAILPWAWPTFAVVGTRRASPNGSGGLRPLSMTVRGF